MMGSTVAGNVSRPAAPLSANPSRNPLRLQARTPIIAGGYTYACPDQVSGGIRWDSRANPNLTEQTPRDHRIRLHR
jgi:hypothetical protein